jgi:hypothetical protein
LKKTSSAIGFLFLIFGFEFLKRLQSSEPLYTKMHLNLLLVAWDDGLYGHIPQSFPPNPFSKIAEDSTIFLGITACEYKYSYVKKTNNPQCKPKKSGTFTDFFSK